MTGLAAAALAESLTGARLSARLASAGPTAKSATEAWPGELGSADVAGPNVAAASAVLAGLGRGGRCGAGLGTAGRGGAGLGAAGRGAAELGGAALARGARLGGGVGSAGFTVRGGAKSPR